MVVGTGVDMTSDEDHVINTVGSIALDGTDLTFTATNNIVSCAPSRTLPRLS